MKSTAMKNSHAISIIIFMSIIVFCSAVCAGSGRQVKTDKDIYETGETVRVSFSNAPGDNHDWICIVAADARDDDAGDYKYMPDGVSEGDLTFDAPAQGKYEVRAYYNYKRNGYVVSARYSFSVADKASAAKSAADKKIMNRGESRPLESTTESLVSSGGQRHNVAVFYFTPLSIDAAGLSVAVTNILANDPKMQSSFAMLSKKDLELFLSGNNLQQNDHTDNVLDIGSRLGLNFVIAGNIEKTGAEIITNCMVVNIARKMIIFRKRFTSRGEADLADDVSKMSKAIIEAIISSN